MAKLEKPHAVGFQRCDTLCGILEQAKLQGQEWGEGG
jgi:hypothetical protein